MKISINDFTCYVTLSKKPGKLLATAELRAFEVCVLKGFRISQSQYLDKDLQEQIWIQPPSVRIGKYFTMFHIEDEDLWREIKCLIYDKYNLLRLNTPHSKIP